MRNGTEIMRDAQRVIREQLDLRGITLKIVAAKSGLPYSTLCSYFPGNERGSVPKQPAEMGIGAFHCLFGAIPSDLLNLLVPEGFAIVQVPAGLDWDAVSSACREFIDCKDKAHHPESEAGRDIGPTEGGVLGSKIARLRAVA